VYTKEENDPLGDQVLCLSNLLNGCGIECDIDLYHNNDVVNDWSYWVGKRVEYHITSQYGYVILVCSPTMISILEETSENARVEMVAANIDRLTLRHYLQSGAKKFLPLFINDSSANVPPNLSGKTSYHFPYDKLSQLPRDIIAHQVIEHPEFASLRNLVATLTGQPEFPAPQVGQGKSSELIVYMGGCQHK